MPRSVQNQTQMSLFGGTLEPKESHRFDPTTLPIPEKRGPSQVRFGTSSWTYPGWSGHVYRDVAAYGKSFDQRCLSEYARDPRFRTVGADNLYYVAPAQRLPMLKRFAEQLVAGVDLCPKVWHGVTVNRYTSLQQAQFRLTTEINRDFLDPQVFVEQVLFPLHEGLGNKLGPLILEIQENELSPEAFALALERFFAGARKLCPWPFRIAVELRKVAHFTKRYLDVLYAYNASHALNSWTRMPPVGEQLASIHKWRKGDRGFPGEVVLIRALLSPSVRYTDAVEAYKPYDRLVKRLPTVRADILEVAREALLSHPVYVLVNNRLEGHAPGTISELLDSLAVDKVGGHTL